MKDLLMTDFSREQYFSEESCPKGHIMHNKSIEMGEIPMHFFKEVKLYGLYTIFRTKAKEHTYTSDFSHKNKNSAHKATVNYNYHFYSIVYAYAIYLCSCTNIQHSKKTNR